MYYFSGTAGDLAGIRSRIRIVGSTDTIDSPIGALAFTGDIYIGKAAVTGAPFTISCWVIANSLTTQNGAAVAIGRKGSSGGPGATLGSFMDYFIGYAGSPTNQLVFRARRGANTQSTGITFGLAGVTNGELIHLAGTADIPVANPTRATLRLYVNGTLRSTIATTTIDRPELLPNVIAWGGFNFTSIGCLFSNFSSNGFTGAENYWAGQIGEVGIWDAVLNATEIMSLYEGFKASQVRPDRLKLYMPLAGERNLISGTDYAALFEGTAASNKPTKGTGGSGNTRNTHPLRYG